MLCEWRPVSFWFCQRADGRLRAVLCDVRNTFGERHFYLLDDGACIADGAELRARKVFHVSPFNALAGEYRFRFVRTRGDAGAASAVRNVTSHVSRARPSEPSRQRRCTSDGQRRLR